MAFDPQFAINVAYPAANSAYLIQTVPNPPLPAGFALAGAIEADPQQAAALMAKTDPKMHVMVNAMLADSNIFGLVAWNATTQTAIVSFRGTVDVHDWIDDLDAVPVDYVPVAGIGLVHMGFQLVYEHVRGNVGGLLQNQCKGVKKILITGHSLGAAVAILSGFDIAKNAVPGSVPDFCTFAGPRAGRSRLRQEIQRRVSGVQPHRQFHGRGPAGSAAASVRARGNGDPGARRIQAARHRLRAPAHHLSRRIAAVARAAIELVYFGLRVKPSMATLALSRASRNGR